jgi:hypothetical protein
VKRLADGRGENVARDSGEKLRDDEPGDAGQDSE